MVEQRQAQAGADGPGPAAPVRELAAQVRLQANMRAQANAGIQVGLGHADVGGGAVQPGFGGADVGPAPGDLGRQAQRQVGQGRRAGGGALARAFAPVHVDARARLLIRQLVAQCPGRSPNSAIWLMLAAACASSGGSCARVSAKSARCCSKSSWPTVPPGRAPPGYACGLPARRCPRAPAGSGAGRCAVRSSCAPGRWPASAGPGPAARPGGLRRRPPLDGAAHAAPQVQFPGRVEAGLI